MIKSVLIVLITFTGLSTMARSYGGIGIAINQVQNGIQVGQVFQGGPADQGGIHKGDLIKNVEGVSVAGKSLGVVADTIRGIEGSLVALTVGDNQRHDRIVTLIRDQITTADCFLEGAVYLTTNSTDPSTNPPTTITGNIGGVPVFWSVSGSLIYANIAGQMFTLSYSSTGTEFMISGFIHSTYISWYGQGNLISAYQSCIE